MAFCNKLGGLLRQNMSQNLRSPMTSMLNSFRCMSSSKLYVGGLSWGTDDQSLKEAFSSFGEVVEARVIVDRNTGRSRGFGFISFSNDESASSAITAMDGQDLQGRSVHVSYAQESSGPRGGGYGGGGYGGGGYGGGDGGFGNRGDGGFGNRGDADF